MPLPSDYAPRPALVTPATAVARPRFAAVDAHNHLGPEFGGNWIARPAAELVDLLDRCDVRQFVDLDGGWGEDILAAHLEHVKAPYPERFAVFGGVDWSRWPAEGNRFGEASADRLEAQVRRGAQGLKVWKPLGLRVRDDRNARVPVDDVRLDPIWARAAELSIPVMLHVADPVSFFQPLDRYNEHYLTLEGHPDWHFYGPEFPPFAQLMDEMASLISRHRRTTFIGAHVGGYSENLAWVGSTLDAHPNFHVDIGARISELGRQPYAARDFFLRYQDRILFGTDVPPDASWYAHYFRFLESRDEYFEPAPGGQPALGGWRLYGLYLPDQVLQKVYYTNAQRLIFDRP